MSATCPALLISAPASGSGKTAVTAGLARLYRRRGLKVRVFKTGPDFLDPTIHARASGAPVYQLDPWMMGVTHCRELLYRAAAEADVILVEGVMGLYDGETSSADLACLFGLPVIAVIDAAAMAQTFGALAFGLARYRPELPFAGVMANNVAGERHAAMLEESLPADLPWMGWLARNAGFALPERHLGILPATEIPDLDQRLDALADALSTCQIPLAPVCFHAPAAAPVPRLLAGVTVGIARDAAFAFLYQANLDLLAAMGARLVEFSLLADAALPAVDALFLPGGYPELHLPALSANRGMRAALKAHCEAGKPVYAECGGMMALFESIVDGEGREWEAYGLLPGKVVMQSRLAALGLQSVALPEGELRGHTFHYSRAETALPPLAVSRPARRGSAEAVYRVGRLTASYLHLYFPFNPEAAAGLFLA